jgi:hypothetical protein
MLAYQMREFVADAQLVLERLLQWKRSKQERPDEGWCCCRDHKVGAGPHAHKKTVPVVPLKEGV